MKLVYPAIFTKHEDNEIVVSFPDIPEIVTSGDSKQEAYEEAQDALCEALAGRINRKENIPDPEKKYKDSVSIPVPIEMGLKVGLYIGQQEENISNVELAWRLGIDEKSVRRLSDPYHHSALSGLEEAYKKLNCGVELNIFPNNNQK